MGANQSYRPTKEGEQVSSIETEWPSDSEDIEGTAKALLDASLRTARFKPKRKGPDTRRPCFQSHSWNYFASERLDGFPLGPYGHQGLSIRSDNSALSVRTMLVYVGSEMSAAKEHFRFGPLS